MGRSKSQKPLAVPEPSRSNHIMSDAVLLRTVARSASNLSVEARAQLLAISEQAVPKVGLENLVIDAARKVVAAWDRAPEWFDVPESWTEPMNKAVIDLAQALVATRTSPGKL